MNINPMLGMPQGAEWLVILAVVILIFGASKLPELARGTGQALKIFKNETKGLRDDEKDESSTATLPPTSELPAAPVDPTAPATPAAPPAPEQRRDTTP